MQNPMKTLLAMVYKAEAGGDVINGSVAEGFPHADVYLVGPWQN